MSVQAKPMARDTDDKPPGLERLVPGARPHPDAPGAGRRQAPAAAMAAELARQRIAKGKCWVHLASSDRRAEEIGRGLAGLAPDLEVLVLPSWDCLPYD